MRIFHGVSSSAGQPHIMAKAQKELGFAAQCLRFGPSRFAYSADIHLDYGKDIVKSAGTFLQGQAQDFDIFHFYFRPFYYFSSRLSEFPSGLDLLALRAAGKKLVMHYRGSEVRTAEKFKQFSPYNYVDDNPDYIFEKFPTDDVERWTHFMSAVCHEILVPDIELQSYVPGSKVLERAINLTDWKYQGPISTTDPLVVHAPTRRGVKGTSSILKAIENLKNKGLKFRFELVEDLEQADARKIYEGCDILVDQLRIGWYGVLAVEAMALGKTVLTYIREDLEAQLQEPLPLINCNPTNIEAQLEKAIKESQLRVELAEKARRYCEVVHDSKVVAQKAIEIYQKIPNDFVEDLPAIIQHLEWLHTSQSKYPQQNNLQKFINVTRKRGLGEALKYSRSKIWSALK